MTGPGRPILPPEAEQEILSLLFEGMGIESAEIAAILKSTGSPAIWSPSRTATASG